MNRLIRIGLTGSFGVLVINAGIALSQETSAQRARVIVASFNKKKHVVREKKGIRVEKYKEIRSEPVILRDIRDYSGSYEAEDLGLSLDLQVDSNRSITGR